MKTSKKVIALLLMVALLVSVAACSSKDSSNNKETIKEEDTSKVDASVPSWKNNSDDDTELSWYLNLSWVSGVWGEDWTTEYMKEKTGFNISVITPSGNESEKLNTMIASNDMPDIITLGWWEPQVPEMISAGLVLPLNELADKYDPYFYEVAKEDILNWNKQADGNVYGYNCFTTTPSDIEERENVYSNRSFLVRKDMWEELGKPSFDTPENFYNALKAAKEAYPNVNDGMSMIPLGVREFDETGSDSLDEYLCDWLGIPYEVDGKLYDRITDPEYITWMKMFRQCYEDGLLAKDVLIDGSDQIGEKFGQGRYFAALLQWVDHTEQQSVLYSIDPESAYISVDGPRNSNGNEPTLAAGSINGWLTNMITSSCSSPKRAMEFFTYMISPEGQKDNACGPLGKTYNEVDGEIVYTEEYLDLMENDPTNYASITGVNDWGFFQDENLTATWITDIPQSTEMMREGLEKYTVFSGAYEIPDFDPDSKEAIARQKIDELWGKAQTAMLTAASEEEFDAVLEQFIKDRDAAGYEMLMEAMNAKMLENKEKLNLD